MMANEKAANNSDLLLSQYTYELPETLIAQRPATPRDSSRLLVVNSLSSYVNSIFLNLADWLNPSCICLFFYRHCIFV